MSDRPASTLDLPARSARPAQDAQRVSPAVAVKVAMATLAGAVFASAFLLFLVQPLIAKQILPWFGGTAAVWTLCVVFFQTLLVAGYAYADRLTRMPWRRQVLVHGIVVLAACATLPILADPSWKPLDGRDPSIRILLVLAVTVGLPYFVLSTTSPLMQSWFSRLPLSEHDAKRVYRLFALSNLASLVALLAYPFAIEPVATVREQAWGWSLGFVVFGALVAAGAWSVRRFDAAALGANADPAAHAAPHPLRASKRDLARWSGLAALGTVLLVSATAHITQNVASVPFLWIAPLAVYLLSFIVAFERKRGYPRALVRPMLLLALPMMAWGLSVDHGAMDLRASVAIYTLGLLLACLFCHGELANARPAPGLLTRYYLAISIGGAVGGLFVGLVAPQLFDGYWELPLALVACAALLAVSFRPLGRVPMVAAILAGLFCLGFGWRYVDLVRGDSVMNARTFYGTLRVDEVLDGEGHVVRRLLHGAISHGEQYLDARWRREPSTYYTRGTGVRLAWDRVATSPRRLGVVGLGTGTLAAFAGAGDTVRFYELDPAVVDAARAHFTYLADAQAAGAGIDIATGDARITLEREAPQRYDVFVVDAFSSDAVPVHLLTAESLALYRRHLAPGGVVVFHVSNRFLNLPAVIERVATMVGMQSVRVRDDPPGQVPRAAMTDYVVVGDDLSAFAADARVRERRVEATAGDHVRPWTDDYSNLASVLKPQREAWWKR